MRILYALGVAAVAFGGAAAQAHHSFAAEFNAGDPVNLTGTIAQVKLMNPHSWIYIDVPQPGGAVVQWGIEGGSPNTLFRKGFTKASLPVGTKIIVSGFRARDKSNSAVGVSVTFEDGKKLFMGGTAPGADGPAAQ